MAVDELGNFYAYREYAEPDKIISEGSEDIVALSEGENITSTYAPSDLMSRSQESGKTKADLFRENGLLLTESNRDRETGWLAIKDLLKVYDTDEGKDSRLKIFNTCTRLLEYLPALQRDAKHPTDCMTEPHDITHLPDALRYFCIQYMLPSKPAKKQETELDRYKSRALGKNKKRRSF